MKCPNCGFELVEGYLYCDNCGEEIRIVPDFEPEIENSMIETLSTLAEEIDQGDEERKPDIKSEIAKETRTVPAKGKTKINLSVKLITFTIVLLIALIVGVHMYQLNSVPYHISRAKEYAELGNYNEAIRYLGEAEKLTPGNVEILFMTAGYYYLNQENEKALNLLLSMVESDKYNLEEKEKCYEKIIAIYDAGQQYQEIHDLLAACEDEAVVTQFQHYMAMEPEFSYGEGTYAEVIPLKLSSNTTGKIFYTLDGSVPTEKSSVYTAPIFLETGDYVLSAIFINDYGIVSKIVKKTYHISLIVPDSPEVLLYSGLYVKPTMIEVLLPESGTVYYTIDGKNPTIDSSKYTNPVSMPLGKSVFKFITVSEEGVASEVISRNYELKLMTDITTEIAIKKIIQALIERRVLTDIKGSAFGMDGHYVYKFNTIIEIPDKGYYYLIYEYYEDPTGVQSKTERLYAVEAYTGAPNRLIYNELGEMDLISLE